MATKDVRLADLDNAVQRFGEAWADGNMVTLEIAAVANLYA